MKDVTLPKEQFTLEACDAGESVIAGCWENDGYRHYEKIPASNLPNDLISRDDLKRCGVDVIDGKAGGAAD